MKGLIIGAGEVGESLYYTLFPEKKEDIKIMDKDNQIQNQIFDILHICFPYSKDFVIQVQMYQNEYKPQYTVIHSTVPVGTSRLCNAIHSPIIGIHPFLTASILAFTKFLGGEGASDVADYFRKSGIKVYLVDKSETTELMKLLDTTFYGICIEYTKEVKRQCKKFDIPFETWTLYNDNYNKGYKSLGRPEFIRPNLIPIMGEIGGHCVLNNCEFLETPFTNLIKELNKKYE